MVSMRSFIWSIDSYVSLIWKREGDYSGYFVITEVSLAHRK